ACLVLQQDSHVYSAIKPSDAQESISFLKTGEFISLMQNARKPQDVRELYLLLKRSAEIKQVRDLNMKLFIPLNHRGHLQGVFCLGARQDHQAFSEQELALLNLLSVQISIALENTQLYQERLEKQRMDEELTVAGEIQRMLLPQKFPTGKRFDISAINIPSKEVGGDYFDFIELADDKIGIAIGDIAGKGIPGALLMSNLQASFRAAAQLTSQPAKVMEMVNAQITRSTSPEKYATFLYGIFDGATDTFTFANAGHNFPVLVRRGEPARMLKQSDLIIGINATVSYQNHQTDIQPGDFLVVYTDGITEALNVQNEEFGEERFLSIMGERNWDNPRELRDFIYESVHAYTSGASQYDDITLVVFQVK
ncbi:SpoIIE family protein phosphatase, partial [bacterium]|nr:SpoIIE family protein phosphatase [bacterium]